MFGGLNLAAAQAECPWGSHGTLFTRREGLSVPPRRVPIIDSDLERKQLFLRQHFFFLTSPSPPLHPWGIF